MFHSRLIVVALMLSILTGCATINPMAFDKTSKSIDTSKKSVLLMTIDVSRSDGKHNQQKNTEEQKPALASGIQTSQTN